MKFQAILKSEGGGGPENPSIGNCLLLLPHKSSSVLPIDAMSSDGHEMTLCSHNVTQHRKMSVVHVQSVERQNKVHFLLYTFPDCFDAKT